MRRISYKEVVRDVKGVREEEENRWMVHKSEHDQRRKRNVNYFLLAFTTRLQQKLESTTTKPASTASPTNWSRSFVLFISHLFIY